MGLPGFNLKIWMFTKINFRTSYLGILINKNETVWVETFIQLKNVN